MMVDSFIIAMISLINRYINKMLSIASYNGIIMLAIGLLMIFKPEWNV